MTETTEQMGADCMKLAGPSAAHEKLHPFAGTFKAEVKMWFGPGDPHVSTGVMKNELDLDGRFLRQTYKGDASDGPFPNFEGRGFWGYNRVTDEYEGFWIDSASTFMQTEAGGVDGSGKVWTMIGEIPNAGGTIQKRSVVTLEDKHHHKMAMYCPGPDGNERKIMEIAYKRK